MKQDETRNMAKVQVGEIDLSKPVDLVVLGIKQGESARCRRVGSDKEITLRMSGLWNVVPGEIVTVMPQKHWSYAGHPYLSGDITGSRIDISALGLTPLTRSQFGMWDPSEHYWGEEGEHETDWEKEVKAVGPRPVFELENVIPGKDPKNFDSDPILEAIELQDAGDSSAAGQLLNRLLIADLRCLDAHTHLGNLEFTHRPEMAIRHYEIGVQIGNLSLGPDFAAVLPWGLTNNRPYLRCLHGYGLCLWRIKRVDEAAAVFSRLLWLNPSDNQGARFNLAEIQDGTPWKDRDTA